MLTSYLGISILLKSLHVLTLFTIGILSNESDCIIKILVHGSTISIYCLCILVTFKYFINALYYLCVGELLHMSGVPNIVSQLFKRINMIWYSCLARFIQMTLEDLQLFKIFLKFRFEIKLDFPIQIFNIKSQKIENLKFFKRLIFFCSPVFVSRQP